MRSFIDQHRERFGVEPICKLLRVAPSAYWRYAARRQYRRFEDDGFVGGKDGLVIGLDGSEQLVEASLDLKRAIDAAALGSGGIELGF